MEIINFLNKLNNFGIDNDYFELKKIGNLDKSCCQNSTLDVIDFDKAKDKICQKANIPSLKSCDAIKFILENERIDFIELKGLSMYLNYGGRTNFDPNLDTNSQITNKITGFEINRKIEESLSILKKIMEEYNGNEETLRSVLKNFLIVTDITPSSDPIEFITITLEVLSEISTPIENICLEIFNNEIKNTNLPNNYNINQPIPLTCESLMQFYSI
jgi:hypothetical protein